MEAGVEDEGLARHHGPPADGQEGDGQPGGGGEFEEFHEVSDRVGTDAQGGDQHAPEVHATVSLEGEEDEVEQFDHVIPGDADKNGHGEVGSIMERSFGIHGRHDDGSKHGGMLW